MSETLDLKAGDSLTIKGEIVLQFVGAEGQLASVRIQEGEELTIKVTSIGTTA